MRVSYQTQELCWGGEAAIAEVLPKSDRSDVAKPVGYRIEKSGTW